MRLHLHDRTSGPIVACLLLILSLLTGCGDRSEHHLEQARIAVSNSRYEVAIERAAKVLEVHPDDLEALRIKASSEQRLNRFAAARDTLLAAVKAHPSDATLRIDLVDWAVTSCRAAMDRSDFSRNPALRGEFDKSLSIGREQVEQLKALSPASSAWRLAEVRLLRVELQRGRAELAELNLDPGLHSDQPGVKAKAHRDVVERTAANEALMDRMTEHLEAALAASPGDMEALSRLADLLANRGQWRAFWALAERAAGRSDLTAAAAENLVDGLLMMPEVERLTAQRLELARKVQNAVAADQRQLPEYQLNSARLHHAAGEWTEAAALIDAVRTAHPHQPRAMYLMAQNALGRGDPAAAAVICEQVLARQTSLPTQLLYAQALSETNRLELAIAELRRALERYPNSDAVRQTLIRMLSEGGFGAEARRDVEEYVRRQPTDPEALGAALRFALAMGDRAAAIETLEEIAAIEHRTPEHLRLLVDGFGRLGAFDRAIEYAQELCAQRPDLIGDQLSLASVLLGAGRVDEAQQVFDQLRTAHGPDNGLEASIAMTLMRHRPDLALAVLEALNAREPENPAFMLMHAQGLAATGRYDDALAMVDRVLTVEPRHLGATALAWRICQITGQADQAARWLQQAAPESLGDSAYPALRAHLYMHEGKYKEAIAVCTRQVLSGDNDPLLRLTLALLYRKTGNQQMVEAHLAGLVAAEPGNRQTWQMLTQYYLETRETSRGLNMFDDLSATNAVMAAVSKAALLIHSHQHESATMLLEPVFTQTLARRDPRATVVADVLARAHLEAKSPRAAASVYTQLIDAGLDVSRATLRRIDVSHDPRQPQATIDALIGLAGRLGDSERSLQVHVVRRLASLGAHDQALALLDDWSARATDRAALLAVRSQVLLSAQKPAEAVEALTKAVELAPESVEHRLNLGALHERLGDYPAAEAAYRAAATLGPRAAEAGLDRLIRMYARIGLDYNVIAACTQLEAINTDLDGQTLLTVGRAYLSLGDRDKGVELLGRVRRSSPAFGPAQVELALLEVAQGQEASARQRVAQAVNDHDTAAPAVAALLDKDVRDPAVQGALRWCEGLLDPDKLTPALATRWLSMRVILAANAGDTTAVLESLIRLAQLQPELPQLVAARVALLLALDRREEAELVYEASGNFSRTTLGQLLAVALGREPTGTQETALYGFVAALAAGDTSTAAALVNQIGDRRGVFRSDLRAMASSEAVGRMSDAQWRELAKALAALDSGLPHVAESTALKLIESPAASRLVLVHAIHAQALLSQHKPTEPARMLVQRHVPGSALLHELEALRALEQQDTAQAATHLRQALDANPSHVFALTDLAALLRQDNQASQAIAYYADVAGRDSPLRAAATIELIELKAAQGGPALAEAHELAMAEVKAGRASVGLTATLGWVEHLRGRDDVALLLLRSTLPALSDRPIVHYRLGTVYQALGQQAWVRYHLERAAAGPDHDASARLARDLLAQLPK